MWISHPILLFIFSSCLAVLPGVFIVWVIQLLILGYIHDKQSEKAKMILALFATGTYVLFGLIAFYAVFFGLADTYIMISQ